MANIKVTLDYEITDGQSLTFKAPCDSTAVTGLIVYYPIITESSSAQTSKTFTFKDAHGNALTSIGNLFTTNAYIKVILDTTNSYAYIQNSDTNGYLEEKIDSKATTSTLTTTISTTWSSSTPYTQNITVSGITSTDNPCVDVVLTGDSNADKLILEAWGTVNRIVTSTNAITVYCYDVAPSVAIPIQLKVVR